MKVRRYHVASVLPPAPSSACALTQILWNRVSRSSVAISWSDEPGFEDEIAATGVTGVCGSAIIEAVAELYLSGMINQDGLFDGAMAAKSPRVIQTGRTFAYVIREGEPLISITQNDVRAIQLAKAALYAGVQLLMDKLELEKVDTIRLAGAFGSHIDVKYAMILGLIPDCDLAHVHSAGNAAGTGARIALLNTAGRDEIEEVVRRIEKIETAVEPKFQQHFIEAMAMPHKTAPFPQPGIRGEPAADQGNHAGWSRWRRRP